MCLRASRSLDGVLLCCYAPFVGITLSMSTNWYGILVSPGFHLCFLYLFVFIDVIEVDFLLEGI